MKLRKMPDDEGGMIRQYIPALVNDNPSLLEDDPTYISKLRGLGSKALVDAKLKGFQDRAYRCRAQLDNFQLIDDSMDTVVTGQQQRQYLVGDKSPSANICS